MPHDQPPAARRVEPDELPLWLPGEGLERAMFELCRDHWPAIRGYALTHGSRGVAVVDRASAEKQGTWPPPVLLAHSGQEYGIGSCRYWSRHPVLQADLVPDHWQPTRRAEATPPAVPATDATAPAPKPAS